MSDVTGPISTLPGSRQSAPKGIKCDYHPERDAVVRVQGETDSFGSEMHDVCQACADSFRRAAQSPEARIGLCDWCKNEATDLRNRRDFEEGMAGPVYRVCGSCVAKENDELRAELDASDDDVDFDADDGFDS